MTAQRDPTYGRIDPDIQRAVDEIGPKSLGQRVAMENTLQTRRDERWRGDADGPFRVDFLTMRQFAKHVEMMERIAVGPTYPMWKRPFRRWRLHLIDPQGRTHSDMFGPPRTRREALITAAAWNERPLRHGWTLEVHRA